jgi:organic radical activating enzyme
MNSRSQDMSESSTVKQGDRGRSTGADSGFVSEIFCSIQGEGLRVGERQIFFRTAGCSATCYWCDTPAAKEQQEKCVVRGAGDEMLPNPIDVDTAFNAIMSLAEVYKPVKMVSFTGGEPLEQADFVAAIAKRLKKKRLGVYVETSGLEVDGFRKIRPFADVVSADIKLPSATGHEHWDLHREFIKWLVGKDSFVKIVIDAPTPIDEIETAIHLIAEIDRGIPLILQPESSTYLKGARGVDAQRKLSALLEDAQRMGLKCLADVRVIPQCHKIIKVR